MRRCPGIVLIATLLWLGWLDWGQGVRGSALNGRTRYADFDDVKHHRQLNRWNPIPYGVSQRTRRGHEPPAVAVRQCQDRLPKSIQAACLEKQQSLAESRRQSRDFPGGNEEDSSVGGMYGRVMMRKRSSGKSTRIFTNAYEECCLLPCTKLQLQKYCHHYISPYQEPKTTTPSPAPTESAVTLVSVNHRLLGNKHNRLNAKATQSPTTFQNLKPANGRLSTKTPKWTAALLRQTSKCLADMECNDEFRQLIVWAFQKQPKDSLESLEQLCMRGKRGGSLGKTALSEGYVEFASRFRNSRPCKQIPIKTETVFGTAAPEEDDAIVLF